MWTKINFFFLYIYKDYKQFVIIKYIFSLSLSIILLSSASNHKQTKNNKTVYHQIPESYYNTNKQTHVYRYHKFLICVCKYMIRTCVCIISCAVRDPSFWVRTNPSFSTSTSSPLTLSQQSKTRCDRQANRRYRADFREKTSHSTGRRWKTASIRMPDPSWSTTNGHVVS